jgi:hypothetical protein
MILIHKSFDDIFDTAHPVFLWIFRASFNWECIRDLIAGMQNHLKFTGSENSAHYSLLLREMFCVAAQALADSMSIPLESLGIAYDQILETGIRSHRTRTATADARPPITNFGRGQFLFLVKHASRAESAHLLSSGFRFAEPVHVIGTIARAMQIDRLDAEDHLKKMADYYGPQSPFPSGVHIGFIGMRPELQRGFKIMVREKQFHVIPSIQLPVASLDATQMAFVMEFAGKTVNNILQELRFPPTPQTIRMDYDLQSFRFPNFLRFNGRSHFHGALISLSQEIKEPDFMKAVLVPQTFEVTASFNTSSTDSITRSSATLIILRIIIPFHHSTQLRSSQLIWSPLSLFLTQQTALSAGSKEVFIRESRKEFMPLFENTPFSDVSTSSRCPRRLLFSREHQPEKRCSFSRMFGNFKEDVNINLEQSVASENENRLTCSLEYDIRSPTETETSARESLTVMVNDNESCDTNSTSVFSPSSMSDLGGRTVDDAAVWVDICFKGINIMGYTEGVGRTSLV